MRTLFSLALLSSFIILTACSSTNRDSGETAAQFDAPDVDFSGNWEKDYALSDDFNSRFNLFLFDVQRSIAPAGSVDSLNAPPVLGGSRDAIIGLAQLTEEITRTAELVIQQDDDSINIEREDNFALRCELFQAQFSRLQNTFGSEICGWNGEQLVFRMNLTNGLTIFHQVTLSPNRQQLNITTSVSSASVSSPLTVSSYYRRYIPPEQDYNCILTLTRNNVCSRRGL